MLLDSNRGMLFYKISINNSLPVQKVAIGSITNLSTKKKFISGLPKYPTGPRSTVGLNYQKIKIKKKSINVTEFIYISLNRA